MEKISNRALISRLFSSADHQLLEANYDLENWQAWYEEVQKLSVPEKMVYVIVKMNQSVTGGGFSEFYEKSFGIFAPEIIHVLNEINANKTAEIVSNSLTVVNPNGLLDNDYKAFIFTINLTSEQRLQLQSNDINYDHLEGIENLEDLLGNHLQEVVKDFI